MTIKPGDPVKLTDRYANVLLRTRRCKVDWLARRGVAARVGRQYVFVIWDGNRALDNLLHAVVEIA